MSEDWLSRMKRTNKKVAFFYGSQTGTAEEYAQRLVVEARAYVAPAAPASSSTTIFVHFPAVVGARYRGVLVVSGA